MCRTAVCYARLLVRKGADKTETKAGVAFVGVAAVAAVHLAVAGVVVPAAAAANRNSQGLAQPIP